MAWDTAVSDLRTKLSDNATDKLRAFKRVFGQLDGSNTLFKTFEFRRITDFTGADAPLGVYLNGALVSVSDDNVQTGYFTLASAPSDGDALESTYYIQWFLDAEVQSFLRIASNWLGSSDDYTAAQVGLRPSLLTYAAGEAYHKLSLKWSEMMSETYRLEDSPNKGQGDIADKYKKSGDELKDEARLLRNDFYTRQGQALQPLFGAQVGNFRDPGPPR